MKPYDVSPEQVSRFRRERDAFRLRFRCPDCVHARSRPSSPGANAIWSCTLGYPNDTLMAAEGFLEGSGQFVFCKYFELV